MRINLLVRRSSTWRLKESCCLWGIKRFIRLWSVQSILNCNKGRFQSTLWERRMKRKQFHWNRFQKSHTWDWILETLLDKSSSLSFLSRTRLKSRFLKTRSNFELIGGKSQLPWSHGTEQSNHKLKQVELMLWMIDWVSTLSRTTFKQIVNLIK